MNCQPILENKPIHVSVPCRIDFGGTLDISTFYLPMAALRPATLNIALDMRTYVSLEPWERDRVKISSVGFTPYEAHRDALSFSHPLGLMSAVVRFFNAHGVHVRIRSTSPTKSALGGSSSAAVALIAAFYRLKGETLDPEHIVWLAHYIEASVAGVPCGAQDQTAAAFGGVTLWEWTFGRTGPAFNRIPVYDAPEAVEALNDHILVAYCGIPHVSKDVNSQWVQGFIQGSARPVFEESVRLTRAFTRALQDLDFDLAGELMNRETRIRCEITAHVLDKTGKKLFERASDFKCGARFTGAGGGGCLWAVGDTKKILELTPAWEEILDPIDGAGILSTRIDAQGIITEETD